jgi:antitoxin HicB
MAKKYQKIYQYTVVFEPDEDGGFVVTVPALPGCFTQGETFEEAVKMAEDAIKCFLDSMIKHNEPIPEEPKREFIGTINVRVSKDLSEKVNK